MNDQHFLAVLGDAFDDVEPVPAHVLDVALAAIELRDLDGKLADLIFDSWSLDQELVLRTTSTETRLLTFAHDDITIDLELQPGGTLVGQIEVTGRPVAFDGAVTIEIESAAGSVDAAEVDRYGRFRRAIASGPVRLRFCDRLVTPWIAH